MILDTFEDWKLYQQHLYPDSVPNLLRKMQPYVAGYMLSPMERIKLFGVPDHVTLVCHPERMTVASFKAMCGTRTIFLYNILVSGSQLCFMFSEA